MDIIGTMTKLLNRLSIWNLTCDINEIVSCPKQNTHWIIFDYKNIPCKVSFKCIEPFRIKLDVVNCKTNAKETVETSINCNEHDLYFFGQALAKITREG